MATLQPESERLLGATSMEEQVFCEWFAEHCLTRGGVVELGPWLGSLTIPTLRGIRKNTILPAVMRVIDTYDLFYWHQWCETWVAETPFAGRLKTGDSFLPLYKEIVVPHAKDVVLRIHQEDLEQTRWTRKPIEFLINDAWKTVLLMSNTIHEFFPSLLPNAVVFHQDYLWASESFIHIGMFHLRDCFAFDFRIPRSQAAVFRKLREIPVPIIADLCSRRTPQDFSEAEILEAFEWSKSLFSDPEARLVADAGKAWMLHSIGKSDAARSIFREIKKSDHYMHPFYQFQENTLRGWGLGAVIEFP